MISLRIQANDQFVCADTTDMVEKRRAGLVVVTPGCDSHMLGSIEVLSDENEAVEVVDRTIHWLEYRDHSFVGKRRIHEIQRQIEGDVRGGWSEQ